MAEQGQAADTSAIVAAHIAGHDHRHVAAAPVAACTHVLGPVVAETWSVLRRHFRLPAADVAAALDAYMDDRVLVAPDTVVYRGVVDGGVALDLAGNVHDFVIARTAALHGLRLITLDRGMRRFTEAHIHPLV